MNANSHTFHASSVLDCSQFFVISEILDKLSNADCRKVTVDLSHTQEIRDSGLGMLLLLGHKADKYRKQIELTNCNSTILPSVSRFSNHKSFHIQCPKAA